MKRTMALLLAIMLAALSFGGVPAEAASAVTSETVPLYVVSADNKQEITLYYKDGVTEIPYIDMETAKELLMTVMKDKKDTGYELTLTQEGKLATFKRENGAAMQVDFANGEIAWDDYNRFIAQSYSTTSLDVLENRGFNEAGEPELFQRNLRNSYVRRGENMGLRFEDFFIDLIYQNGKGYMPLQTVSDLMIAYSYYLVGYNGEAVFLIKEGDLGDMAELYYAVEPKERSAELARFNYVEMCLSLQFNYGLKDAQKIPSFGTLFERTGIEEALQSPDAQEATVALYDVIFGYISDLHTTFSASSPYAGPVSVKPTMYPRAIDKMNRNFARYAAAVPEEAMEAYKEVGNTAYIMFNKFDGDLDTDYYAALEAGEKIADTIGIIMYAHRQITRENSPIENVVLDLSLNTGGWADAAVYTIAWFLGDCTIHSEDAITGEQASMSYNIDVNGDRVFDEKDSIAHLNRYCIISPVSFSCGNLVPSVFKDSGEVTLLGRRSGGGACAVQPLSMADGTLWRISGRQRLSTMSNGSLYDVDQGVEPDIVIDKLEHFYDREAMTEFLNNLL